MKQNSDFYDFLQKSSQIIFIEVEGRSEKINEFIKNYSDLYGSISDTTEGVCTLSSDVDKWGLEYRIYFNDAVGLPSYWDNRKYKNKKYRADQYNYRLDDKNLVEYLFKKGYKVGCN